MADEDKGGGGSSAPLWMQGLGIIILIYMVWYVSGGVPRGEQRAAEGRNSLWIKYETALTPGVTPDSQGNVFTQPGVVQVEQNSGI